MSQKIPRRTFLKLLAGGGAFLASGCSSLVISETDSSPKLDKLRTVPEMGDVIKVGNDHFLLRNKKSYRIPDIERYKRATKFDKYKRKIFQSDSNIFREYRQEQIQDFSFVNDPFTSGVKDPKLYGGEINVFFPGFMTDGGYFPSDYIIVPEKDTFF